MIVGLEVFEEEKCAELKILAKNVEFVIQILYDDGDVLLELEKGEFKMQGLNVVSLEPGLDFAKG